MGDSFVVSHLLSYILTFQDQTYIIAVLSRSSLLFLVRTHAIGSLAPMTPVAELYIACKNLLAVDLLIYLYKY